MSISSLTPFEWKAILQQESRSPYFNELSAYIEKEYGSRICHPPKERLFEAFRLCPWDGLKIVILGQDPYHGIGQANGLAFSVNAGVKTPPSLVNIFKEIADNFGKPIRMNGDLSDWASQGVLLLNTVLTVRSGEAGSHQNKGWEIFTDAVIKKIAEEKQGIVFLLWGKPAQSKIHLIPPDKHHILTSAHPSPLSAYRGFLGNKHFIKANQILLDQGMDPIDWSGKQDGLFADI